MTEGLDETRERALVGLLDDPSPVVQEALRDEFRRLGGAGLSLLREVVQHGNSEQIEKAEQLIVDVTGKDAAGVFIEFIESLQYDLETGMYLIGRIFQPDLPREALKNEIDRLTERCEELCILPLQPLDLCNVINRVLFHEEGYRGNIDDYENPENSLLNRLFETKKGIPLSLSVLYILVAERLGFHLEPVAFPGHFLVGCFEGTRPFYIDPFERGRIRRPDGLKAYLVKQGIEPEFHFLAPATVGEVLCRACRNLERHLMAKSQTRLAGQFNKFVAAFETVYSDQD